MGHLYTLDGHTPVPCDDTIAWGEWYETAKDGRRVAHDTVGDKYRISTVFLGIDHRYGGDGPPLLFETMVFPIDSFGYLDCRRCSTWEEAEQQHAEVLAEWRQKVLGGAR